MDLDNPDRRPYWSNLQTNEEHFGVLGFEPGTKDSSILVDGEEKDWDLEGVKPIYQLKDKKNPLKEVRISSDNGYLYFLLTYNHPVHFSKQGTYLLFDTVKDQGQTKIPLTDQTNVQTNYGIDFLVKLTGSKDSRILVDSYYDPFYYEYAKMLHLTPEQPNASKKDNGVFDPIRLALDKGGIIPASQAKIPFRYYETGRLKYGDANPAHKDFDSLTDVSISKDKKIIEGRIPWQLLNVKDPSLKEGMGDLWKSGLTGSQAMDGIRVAVAVANQQKLEMTLPQETNGLIEQSKSVLYQWRSWEEPAYYERLKNSYDSMKETYASTEIK